MPARDNPLSSAGLVADPPSQNGAASRDRPPVTDRARLAAGVPEATEKVLLKRARRQGFALMVASSIVSIMMLYGVWWLLHGLL
jgi:hypothetical protein